MKSMQLTLAAAVAGICMAMGAAPRAQADGMQPETSVIIVNEADREASVRVANTDAKTALLLVKLEDVPEDTEPLLVVTPPLARVEAGKTQLVRFMLRNSEPLKTQRLKRATFEGVPERTEAVAPGSARVGMTVRQNLPVIINPKGLAPNREPWTGLNWSIRGDQLEVGNDTPYVVRLAQEVRLLPGNQETKLSRSYILPGEHLRLAMPAGAAGSTGVRLFPATVYGFAVDAYDAPIRAASAVAADSSKADQAR